MSTKVLCVDDDANILAGFQRSLRKRWSIDLAESGEKALSFLERNGPYAVVVADMQMPGMNGIQLLMKVQAKWPDTVRMMLTGNADQSTAVDAVNQGHVFRFLNKPCSCDKLVLALEAGIRQYQLITAERELLEKTLNGCVTVVTEILSVIDPPSFGRGQALRDQMQAFLTSLGVNQSWEYEMAAMLSQIGYVTIPPDVLKKARAKHTLSPIEIGLLTRVPESGSNLLVGIPRLESVARIILYQDKNFDGTGFPDDGVGGEEIPLASRILKVLSRLNQLETQGMARDVALQSLQRQQGQYDPRVLDAAFKCFDVYLPKPTESRSEPIFLKVPDLRVGHLLASNVETDGGLLILAAGQKLTPLFLEKIRNFAKLSGVRQPIAVEPELHESFVNGTKPDH